jgi:hypothetical protein
MRQVLTGLKQPEAELPEFLENEVEDEFPIPEPEPEPKRQPLGRRSLIDDASLHNRRDQLVQIFEGFWGDIGRGLQITRKPDDLVSVFKALEGKVWDDFILLFWTYSTQPGVSGTPSKVRIELRRLGQPIRAADEANRNAYESLQRARLALSFQLSRHERKPVRKEFVRRYKEARQVDEHCRRLIDKDRNLRAELKFAEANFIRREVFRFIKSKRYELNPLNLANAAAGLPYMAWRQSMRRCSKENCILANGTFYQVFKAIRYLVSSAKKKTIQEFVAHFQVDIPCLPSRYRLARTDFAEKWFFLERALREVFRKKLHPKTLPFEITKRYFLQLRVQTHADILLAERAKLKL